MALAMLAACSKPDASSDGELTILLDSMKLPPGTEVVALSSPAPTSTAVVAQPAPPPRAPRGVGAHADSITRYEAVADSAAQLDAAFQRERTALNSEAASFDSSDRRAAIYATRYDAFIARAQAAERVRAERDRARKRAKSFADRLPDVKLRTDGAAAKSALAAQPKPARRATPAVSPATTIALPAGTWAIGLARAGGAPGITLIHQVAAASHDTVRFRSLMAPP